MCIMPRTMRYLNTRTRQKTEHTRTRQLYNKPLQIFHSWVVLIKLQTIMAQPLTRASCGFWWWRYIFIMFARVWLMCGAIRTILNSQVLRESTSGGGGIVFLWCAVFVVVVVVVLAQTYFSVPVVSMRNMCGLMSQLFKEDTARRMMSTVLWWFTLAAA